MTGKPPLGLLNGPVRLRVMLVVPPSTPLVTALTHTVGNWVTVQFTLRSLALLILTGIDVANGSTW